MTRTKSKAELAIHAARMRYSVGIRATFDFLHQHSVPFHYYLAARRNEARRKVQQELLQSTKENQQEMLFNS